MRSISQQVMPLGAQRHHLIRSEPREAARGFCLAIRPLRHTVRGRQFADDPTFLQRRSYLIAEGRIPLSPSRQVLARRQSVSLLVVASAVRQNKVVGEIDGITSPCNEVIDMCFGGSERTLAIEAPAVLKIE